jgi:hypothetical protein
MFSAPRTHVFESMLAIQTYLGTSFDFEEKKINFFEIVLKCLQHEISSNRADA